MDFLTELTALINKHSLENDSNTPDMILANYLIGCLKVYNETTQLNHKWHGETMEVSNPGSLGVLTGIDR